MIDYTQPHWRGVPRPSQGMTQAETIEVLRKSIRDLDREGKQARTLTAINVVGNIVLLATIVIGSAWIRYSVMQEAAQKCVADAAWCQSMAGGAR